MCTQFLLLLHLTAENLCLSHERDNVLPDSSVERRKFVMLGCLFTCKLIALFLTMAIPDILIMLRL